MHSRTMRRPGLLAVAAAIMIALAVSLAALTASAQAGTKRGHRDAKPVTKSINDLRNKVPQFTRDPSCPSRFRTTGPSAAPGRHTADSRDHVWLFNRPRSDARR